MQAPVFHAHATIRHRGNLIKEIINSDGTAVSSHCEKEQVLWEDFKVGMFEFSDFYVDPRFS